MREIKFRAWCNAEKVMAPIVDMKFNDNGNLCSWHASIDNHEHDFGLFGDTSESIEQFTGIKDKNGKEIYEGDIIEAKTGFGPTRWEVFFNTTGYFCRNGKVSGGLLGPEWTVVGNIHENPELLNKKEGV